MGVMDAAESRACLRILLAVARADGKVDTDEARAVEVLAQHAFGAEAPHKAEVFDLEAEIAAVRSPAARHTTFIIIKINSVQYTTYFQYKFFYFKIN